jgi:(p)ppGpp synthase/HD superfamily hydrolase
MIFHSTSYYRNGVVTSFMSKDGQETASANREMASETAAVAASGRIVGWSPEEYARALRFATVAHRNQKVPGTELPYIVHVAQVAAEVIASFIAEPQYPAEEQNVAVLAALLHDTREDTKTGYAELSAIFGASVADAVEALTKRASVGDKPAQMADSLARIQQQPSSLWRVKLADRLTNMTAPPPYWTHEKRHQYREEALRIHAALGAASPYLADRLASRIRDYERYLRR